MLHRPQFAKNFFAEQSAKAITAAKGGVIYPSALSFYYDLDSLC